MADVASRAFKHGKFFHAHSQLTTFFNRNFPLPQMLSWQERKVPPKWSWRVTSCLRGEALPMESLIKLPKLARSAGVIGAATPRRANQIPSSMENQPSSKPSSSPVLLQGSGQALAVTNMKSLFKPLVKPLQPSPRPSNWEENEVPASKVRVNALPLSVKKWKASDAKIPQPSLNSQCQSP